jgi:glycerol kinase
LKIQKILVAVKFLKPNSFLKKFYFPEEIASEVEDTGDVYFVPAFSGLFAPHWKTDARGYIQNLMPKLIFLRILFKGLSSESLNLQLRHILLGQLLKL